MSNARHAVTLLAVAALAIALGSARGGASTSSLSQPTASVVVEPAALRPVEQWRRVTGELRAPSRARLAVQEQGLVTEVAIRAGDEVEQGQVLVKLDDERAVIAVDRVKAERDASKAIVEQRVAELDLAEADLARLERVATSVSTAPGELDDTRTAAHAAKARLAQAEADLAVVEADLRLAERRLSDMTIVAPFEGQVTERSVDVGEWVSEGDPIAEILALDPLEAWLDVPERYIERLSRSAGSIRVRIDALEEEREAVSVSIIPLAEMRSRLFPVRVELANPDERMRPGMTVAGLVPTGSVEPSLLVHKDAIRRDDAGAFVYFDGAGVAAVARVQTLFAVGDHIAIRQGALPPDANVVVEGNERLFPGQPLETTLRESTLQTAESGSE